MVNSKLCAIIVFQSVVNVDLELPYIHIDLYVTFNTNKVRYIKSYRLANVLKSYMLCDTDWEK